MKKRYVARTVTLLLVIVIMGVIFYFSAQPAEKSSAVSESFIESFLKTFLSNFKNLSEQQRTELVESLQFIVRKTAHACVYACLAISAFGFFKTFKLKKSFEPALFSLLLSLVYAVSDELHQTAVEGRSGEVRDVLVDTCGAAFGLALVILICALIKKIRSGKKNTK